jgi:excisionase family DNA binding protein
MIARMSPTAYPELLRTGEAARLLGCSRQHVVDLCERGMLPVTKTGTHRRIARSAIEQFIGRDRGLTRDALQSLWLHRAIAGALVRDPAAVTSKARDAAERFLSASVPMGAERALTRWLELLDEGPEAVLRTLTSESAEAQELRQVSPFVGILSERERQAILRSFREEWARHDET